MSAAENPKTIASPDTEAAALERVAGLACKEVQTNKRTIRLEEFSIRLLPRALRVVKRMQDANKEAGGGAFANFGITTVIEDMQAALMRGETEALELIAMGAGWITAETPANTNAWLAEFDGVAGRYFADLAEALVEVNERFFTRTQAMITSAIQRTTAMMLRAAEEIKAGLPKEENPSSVATTAQPLIDGEISLEDLEQSGLIPPAPAF